MTGLLPVDISCWLKRNLGLDAGVFYCCYGKRPTRGSGMRLSPRWRGLSTLCAMREMDIPSQGRQTVPRTAHDRMLEGHKKPASAGFLLSAEKPVHQAHQ